MNLKDLPDFTDMYIRYKADYDHDKAFDAWWSEVEECLVDVLGDKQTDWVKMLIRCNWELSPTAMSVLDDGFFDEIRKWRDRALA